MSDSGVAIPETGGDRDALLARLAGFREGDVKWRENRAFGLVYQHSEGHTEFLKAAHGLYLSAAFSLLVDNPIFKEDACP